MVGEYAATTSCCFLLLLASPAYVWTLNIHVAAYSRCIRPSPNVYNSSKFHVVYSPTPILGIDDVVNAVTVHGFNGVWGLLATGLLSSRRGYHRTFNPELASHCCGVMYGCGWSQFGANAVYAVLLATWTLLTSGSLCFVLRQLSQLRVDSLDEQVGWLAG